MANVTHIHKCRRKHDKQVHLNGFVIKRLYVVVAAAGFGCYFWFGTALFLFFFFFFFDSAICILFANSDLTVCVTLYMNSMDVDRCTSTSSVSLHKSFIAIWHKWHNNSNGKCVFFSLHVLLNHNINSNDIFPYLESFYGFISLHFNQENHIPHIFVVFIKSHCKSLCVKKSNFSASKILLSLFIPNLVSFTLKLFPFSLFQHLIEMFGTINDKNADRTFSEMFNLSTELH